LSKYFPFVLLKDCKINFLSSKDLYSTRDYVTYDLSFNMISSFNFCKKGLFSTASLNLNALVYSILILNDIK